MKILVVQTAFIGDQVLTIPLLRSLRRACPGGRLTVVTTALGAELLTMVPDVDETLIVEKRGIRAHLSGLRSWSRVRRGTPDVTIAAHRSFRSGLICRISGAPRRIGYRGAPGGFAYTETVARDPDLHAARRLHALAGPIGAGPEEFAPPRLALDREVDERIGRRIRRLGPVATLAPGARWATKRWHVEGFAETARHLARHGRVVLVGSAGERELCERVRVASATEGVENWAGRTSLVELCALLKHSRLLVGNDSAPGHLAAAVGTPVVTIFGPTVPEFGFTPLARAGAVVERTDLECRPCHRHGPRRCPLGHHDCMRRITAARVWEEIERHVETPRERRQVATRPG